MPPRASLRRPSRAPSHEPENTTPPHGSPSAFQKPNLPPLQGTPSSRRQYTYGAAAEPLPSRPSRGLRRGQLVDLSKAVKNVLAREDDDLRDQLPSPSRAQSEVVDPDEDELAAAASEPAPNIRPGAQLSSRPFSDLLTERQSIEGSEADDARSFGMESDVYGDATIASSPGSMPPPPPPRTSAAASALSTRPNPRTTNHLQSLRLQNLAQASPSRSSEEPDMARLMPPAGKSQPPANPITTQQGRDDGTDEAGACADLEDELTRPVGLGRGSRRNTPSATDIHTCANGSPVTSQARPAPSIPEPEPGRRLDEPMPRSRAPRSVQGQRDPPAADAFAAAASSAIPVGSAEPGGDDSGTSSSSASGRWLNGATKAASLSAMFPLISRGSRRPLAPGQDSGADTRVEDEPAIDWWQLLNPWTYVQAMAWIAESAWQRSTHLFNAVFSAGTRHHLLSAMLFLPYIVGAMLALILGLALSNAAIASFKHNSAEDLWAPAAGGASWLWAGGITRKLGAIFPTVSWSSRNRWDDLKDLWEADDFQLSSIEDYVRKIEQAFQTLRDVSKLHDVSLKKLESVVPWVVHMQVKDGKPTVAPEFWHALRDLIHEDGAFLTFERKRGGYEINSEQQWRALAARLVGDATFTNKLNLTIREAENRLNGRLTLWETWVRENDAKVKQSLGSAVDQIKSASSQPEWDDRLRKAVDEQVKDRERQGVFVGRDEYLRHVQDEVASHLSEFRAELAELKPHLEQFVRESVKLASAEAPASMSREDVTALVNGLVRKAFADMNLEALANGKIHVHWDTELRNHVNYLSIATGAVVDMAHSSNTYDPRVRRYGLGAGGREGARPRRAHVAALEPWQEDGECWCAARSRNRRGNPHGASIAVHLGYRIVPQHVVVEHILPGATTEPGARPRDVELYAAIEDAEVRERVLDFAATHFPAADEADWNHTPAALPARFAKIGQFVYEGAELHGGVHVHRLSSELLALGADTDHVIVRATSNYGAANHTCFYRVRLYGHNVELPPA